MRNHDWIFIWCLCFVGALLVVLSVAGCGGAGKDASMPLDEQEQRIWDLTVQCLVESVPEDFAGIDFSEPTILYVTDPCGSPNFAGCAYPWEGYIEVDTFYYNYNDGNGYDDGDGTPINEGLYVHEFKHVILWQAGLEWGHDSFYFGPESPCTDGFLDGRIG